jgi:hypothetical protein
LGGLHGEGDLSIRLDYAITHFVTSSAAVAGMLLVAGAIGEAIAMAFPSSWEGPALAPRRWSAACGAFLIQPGAFGHNLVVTLSVADWLVAGNAARRMLRQMSSTAQSAVKMCRF